MVRTLKRACANGKGTTQHSVRPDSSLAKIVAVPVIAQPQLRVRLSYPGVFHRKLYESAVECSRNDETIGYEKAIVPQLFSAQPPQEARQQELTIRAGTSKSYISFDADAIERLSPPRRLAELFGLLGD